MPGGPRRGERLTVDRHADLLEAVRGAANGDEAAFRTLYRAVQPGLLRYLRVLVGEDAEDVASETWLQIARDIGGAPGEGGRFRAWGATGARRPGPSHPGHRARRP